jgi:hypothetical protein
MLLSQNEGFWNHLVGMPIGMGSPPGPEVLSPVSAAVA